MHVKSLTKIGLSVAGLTHLDDVIVIGLRLDLAELGKSQYDSRKFQLEWEVDDYDKG